MNPWHDARLLNVVANGLFALAVIGAIGATIAWVSNRPYFEFHHVDIDAVPGSTMEKVSPQALAGAIRATEYGSFFTVDMAALRASIEAVPWVRKATVRRVWPDRLVVLIEQHKPYALWHDGRLINTYGDLFVARLEEAEVDGALPQLGGPEGSVKKVVERFAELSELLAPLRLAPVSVTLSERQAWSATLDDGTDLLIGREHGTAIETRVRRWVESYALVTERFQRRAMVIDLRYPNGYAVSEFERVADARGIDELIADVIARENTRGARPAQPAGSRTPAREAR